MQNFESQNNIKPYFNNIEHFFKISSFVIHKIKNIYK